MYKMNMWIVPNYRHWISILLLFTISETMLNIYVKTTIKKKKKKGIQKERENASHNIEQATWEYEKNVFEMFNAKRKRRKGKKNMFHTIFDSTNFNKNSTILSSLLLKEVLKR